MPTKLTYEQVKRSFEQEGCLLLSMEYEGSYSKLDFLCPLGQKGHITWTSFQQGHRCSTCKTYTIDEIEKALEKECYQLLSTKYVNAHTKLCFICPIGHKGQVSWSEFHNKGYRCSTCHGTHKYTIEQIRVFFAKEGYKLLSTSYPNRKAKLWYQCPKGHRGQIRYGDFQQGHRCRECRQWKREKILGDVLNLLYPGKVKQYDNLDFLGQQEVDFSIREEKIAFEYDGEQHFMPTRTLGMSKESAEKNFIKTQQRDQRKNKLCLENGYILIRVAYFEKLDVESIRQRLTTIGKEV